MTTLLRRYSLARIEVLFTLHGITVRAWPDSFNPLVAERRAAGFAGAGSVSIAEAEAITSGAMGAIAQANGSGMDEARLGLAAELQRVLPG